MISKPSRRSLAAPISTLGRDATQFGVKPNSADEQTRALQRAIDETARLRVPLALPPGTYRSSMLTLREGSQLIGIRGATRLIFAGGGPSLFNAERAANVALADLTLLRALVEKTGPSAKLHLVQGADHAFALPKGSARSQKDVYEEIAGAVADFGATLAASSGG